MNTATMRRIDRVLGGPMCAFLTFLRRVTDPFRPAPPPAPRRILVVKLAEQGAWVVAWSALQDAVDMVGADNVFLMTFEENRFVLDQLDLIPEANIIEVRTSGPVRTMLDALSAVRRARREGVDAAVDFEFFARSSAILCYLSGATRRVGFHQSNREASYRGDLFSHRLSFNPRLHVSETFRVIISALREDPAVLPALGRATPECESPPPITIPEDELAEVERMLTGALGVDELPRLVLLNANAGDLLPLRRWSEERYIQLARRVLDVHPDLAVAFTGSGAEARDAARLARAVGSRRCISLGGRTSLKQLVALYSLSEVLVTNDSGPAHYAALSGVDIVTLFGPESPHVFGSLSQRNHVFWKALPCSPCVNAYNDRVTACTNNLCMQLIEVDEVFAKVAEILTARAVEARRIQGPGGLAV